MLITQSVDNIVVATDDAFCNAHLVTNKGSIIPCSIIFTVSPVTTSSPSPSTVLTLASGIPAFSRILLNGASIAFNKAFSPGEAI